MVIIDSSSWVEALRENGQPAVRERVRGLMQSGAARFIPMVRLELWAGVRGETEKKTLLALEAEIPELEITPAIWEEARGLGRRARASGVTVPAPDLLIAACARHHGAAIEASDAHFAQLAKL